MKKKNVYISDHISYAEATASQLAVRHGIDNTPGELQLISMKEVARQCFEPARLHFDARMFISSFFRHPEVNVKAGGSKTSSHPMGEAIDIDCDYYNEKLANGEILTNAMLFYWLKENVEYDQLIWEFGDTENPAWVHISFRHGNNRKQVMQANVIKEDNEKPKTVYLPWDN